MGAWTTTVKAGYTFDGEKQCKCKLCGYTVKETVPALGIPDGKLVVVIPDYDKYLPTESPSSQDKPSSGQTAAPSGGDESTSPTFGAKELITKGKDNTVPTLPTLLPTDDGNQFDGWVNKATGESVKKGDRLTDNIEIVPVWKDCGENNHSDADKDNHCDECGYIMNKEAYTEDTAAPTDEISKEYGAGIQSWWIIAISCFGGVIAVCVVVLAVALKKKK